jgi:hypothetical protein
MADRIQKIQCNAEPVAQVSKPAVSPISKSAGRANSQRGVGQLAGLETRDTADLEVCATRR